MGLIMLSRIGQVVICLGLLSACATAQDRDPRFPNQIDFSRDIRPILSGYCFHCHGPDNETRAADLRLDQPQGLFQRRDDLQIVAKGHPDQSELIRRVLSADPDVRMPPPEAKKSLTAEQQQLLVDWVNSGAEWEPHWSFVPPIRPVVPELNDAAGSKRNPIDAFLLQRLHQEGLSFSPPADPWTQIRRVFLDLTGLPPSPDEADLWLNRIWHLDPAAAPWPSIPPADEQQYMALVDNLLARPSYGERWARRWLDLARYADSNGYEKDRPRSIWPWRDWVINAINSDLPFDQFTIEQLAGDLLPHPSESQRIATGFHRNTMLNEEGGIDPLEFRFHAMTDRVATTGTTWLGLTTGCAQCHTHKFDPVTHQEYFQLLALLNNADEPALELRPADYDDLLQRNREQALSQLQQLPEAWPVTEWDPVPSQVLHVSGSKSEKFHSDESGLVSVTGEIPAKATWQVDLRLTSADVDLLQLVATTPKGAKGPGRSAQGNFVLSELELSLVRPDPSEQPEIPLPIASATASVSQPGFGVEQAFDGNPETGWAIDNGKAIPPRVTAIFKLKQIIAATDGLAAADQSDWILRVRIHQNYGRRHTLGQFQFVTGRSLPPEEIQHRRQQAVQQAFSDWLHQQRRTAVPWTSLRPVSVRSNLPHLRIQDDHSIFVSGDTTKQDFYEVELAGFQQPVTAIRLEALPDERLPGRGPGTTFYEGRQGDFYLTEFAGSADGQPIAFRSATESYAKNQFSNNPVSARLTLDGDIQTGWSVFNGQGERHTAVYILQDPIPAGAPFTIRMNFGRHFASSLGLFRFSATGAAFESDSQPVARRMPETVEQLLLKSDEQLSAQERSELFDQFLLDTPTFASQSEQIRRLLLPPASPTTLIFQERPEDNPRLTFRHHRGEYLQPREQVQPDGLAFLHPWPAEAPKNRLGLARWLVDERNPLTARVIVNQHWAAFFGQGIVSTIDDFGFQGSPPSHPALLDWLATTFVREDRWSIKKLHRRIVCSNAYRQQSIVNTEALAKNPDNSLLAFAPRFRLEAEIVRDSILFAAGILSSKQGGPPVFPPQPPGITEVAFGRPGWDVSTGEDRYRRSIYTYIKRTAPFAMVTTFDGPSGESCIARRSRSNSPLQALTLLNDVMFIDAAGAVGTELSRHSAELLSDSEHLASDQPTDQRKPDQASRGTTQAERDTTLVIQLFRRLLTRFPETDELNDMLRFVDQQRAEFTANPEAAHAFLGRHAPEALESRHADTGHTDSVAPIDSSVQTVEAAVWAALARALFSLDEVQTRN